MKHVKMLPFYLGMALLFFGMIACSNQLDKTKYNALNDALIKEINKVFDKEVGDLMAKATKEIDPIVTELESVNENNFMEVALKASDNATKMTTKITAILEDYNKKTQEAGKKVADELLKSMSLTKEQIEAFEKANPKDKEAGEKKVMDAMKKHTDKIAAWQKQLDERMKNANKKIEDIQKKMTEAATALETTTADATDPEEVEEPAKKEPKTK